MPSKNKNVPRFYFSYEKISPKNNPYQYRQKLQRAICSILRGKTLKEIPDEMEVEIKYFCKYTVYFESRPEWKEYDKKAKFDPKLFAWVSGIEQSEYGMIDNY